jgi:hypothetical protein
MVVFVVYVAVLFTIKMFGKSRDEISALRSAVLLRFFVVFPGPSRQMLE